MIEHILNRILGRRKPAPDPEKVRATYEAREAIQVASRRQVEAERVAGNLRSMNTSNHFAEMLVKLLRHQS